MNIEVNSSDRREQLVYPPDPLIYPPDSLVLTSVQSTSVQPSSPKMIGTSSVCLIDGCITISITLSDEKRYWIDYHKFARNLCNSAMHYIRSSPYAQSAEKLSSYQRKLSWLKQFPYCLQANIAAVLANIHVYHHLTFNLEYATCEITTDIESYTGIDFRDETLMDINEMTVVLSTN